MDAATCCISGCKPKTALLFPLSQAGSACSHGHCLKCTASRLEQGVNRKYVAYSVRCSRQDCEAKFTFEQMTQALSGHPNRNALLGKIDELLTLHAYLDEKTADKTLL